MIFKKSKILFQQNFPGFVLQTTEYNTPWYWIDKGDNTLKTNIIQDTSLSQYQRDFKKYDTVFLYTAYKKIDIDYLADLIRDYIRGESADCLWRDVTFTAYDNGKLSIVGQKLLKKWKNPITHSCSDQEIIDNTVFAQKSVTSRKDYILSQAMQVGYSRCK